MSFPEVSEEPHFDKTSFRVLGKIFVTAPEDGAHIHVFVGDRHRQPAMAMYSEWLEKLHWGQKVVGLRIRLARAHRAAVEELVKCAWEAKAPKSLLKAHSVATP